MRAVLTLPGMVLLISTLLLPLLPRLVPFDVQLTLSPVGHGLVAAVLLATGHVLLKHAVQTGPRP